MNQSTTVTSGQLPAWMGTPISSLKSAGSILGYLYLTTLTIAILQEL
jgi:hypothetical protein